MMVWEVTKVVSGRVLVEADQFDVRDGALVFFVGEGMGRAVFALARGEWAAVQPYAAKGDR